jgi:DNA-binding MarR family transcriptional regulator
MTNKNTGPWGFPWEQSDDAWRWLKMAYITVNREAERLLRPMGLTTQQWRALNCLHHRPGLMHSDLEKILHIEKPSVTSLVGGMVNKGWVIRQHHPDDARIKLVYLTESGQRIHQQTADIMDKALTHLREAVSDEELQTLGTLLKKIIHAYE